MPDPLDEWQERLERHFKGLAEARKESGFPIFALEHGLTTEEVEELTRHLHRYLRGTGRLYPYWLLWVVYATEQGYGYDGHEYWVSFEHNTPYWRERARPANLRNYFSKFRDSYNGVVPSGPWAEWFRNIAWPITHAILPKYLQLQFARSLYQASHQFARMHNPSAEEAGRILAANSWDTSSRFQEFLEQEVLAGRIVLALLDENATEEKSPIYAPTLKRIVDDLVHVRRAGEWLKAARRIVADRFHGVDRSSPNYAPQRVTPTAGGTAFITPNVRPSFMLRRSQDGWSVIVEIPNFSGLARISPQIGQFLRSTRCIVEGTGETKLPAGWLLYGPQRRVVKQWRPAGAPVVTFERQLPLLDNILRPECRFPEGPLWVFRISSDGLAHEVIGKALRPGQRYIVLSQNAVDSPLPFIQSEQIDCENMHAVGINMPEAIQADETEQLEKIGLQVSRNIRLWPAGLCIRNWDGEGHGDWLSTETPCFGIVHDHAVEEYFVRLDSGLETRIEGTRAGHPVFITLSKLNPGRHTLSVRATRIGLRPGSQALRDLTGRVELKVRDPAPWKAGTTAHSGLVVSVEPPDPTLEAFWEGGAQVSAMGPEGREVTCAISLVGRNGDSILSEEIGKFELPINPSAWAQRFKKFASDEVRAWKYLDASTGRFVIRGEELGEYAVQLERDSKPVRWLCRIGSDDTRVRLADDTGQDSEPSVALYPFGKPGESTAIAIDSALEGLPVEEPGGLLLATHGTLRDALIVSSSRGAANFQELLVEPNLSGLTDRQNVLALLNLWHGARIAGPLAQNRKDHIEARLLERFYTILCGSRWAYAEEEYLRIGQVQSTEKLERAMEVGHRNGFPAALRLNYGTFHQSALEGAKWFAEAAQRYDICSEPKLTAFALRLASWPYELTQAFGEETDKLLEEAATNAGLLRGARYLAVLTIASEQSATASLLPRWAW